MVVKRPSLVDLLQLASSELEQSLYKPNIYDYGVLPYPQQDAFHQSDCIGRYISGGNRAGKTTAAVIESIWWATDTHPYLQRPKEWGRGPLQLRFIVVDVSKGIEQMVLPELKKWLPESYLTKDSWEKSWDGTNYILTLKNGSTIDFVTWGMDTKKLGGVKRHLVFFDEEPPQSIFNETLMRLIDFAGRWVIAGSPVDGMTWSYDLLWEPSESGRLPGVDIFQLRQEDNPYLQTKSDQREQYFVGMSEEERAIRERGEFVAKQGLVFPSFNQRSERYIIPAEQIDILSLRNWDWYSSVDFGFNGATAWLWHAVGPRGQIVTFAEHYASKMNVAEHAPVVLARERGFGKTPEIRVGDPNNGKIKIGTTGTSFEMEYAVRGIYINTDLPRDVMIGVEKMQQYLRLQDRSPWGEDRAMWVVSSNCTNLIREMKKLRWAAPLSDKLAYDQNRREEIHKKDDHAPDSLRYFFTVMPDLTPDRQEAPGRPEEPTGHLTYTEFLARFAEDPDVSYVDNEQDIQYANSDAEPVWSTEETW